jgi:hypothetical protein
MEDIVYVEYSELATFGEYQNIRIGATAHVAPNKNADARLTQLRDWVRGQLEQHISQRMTANREADELSMEIHSKQMQLDRLKYDLERGKTVLVSLKTVLEKHGVDCKDLEIPF